MCIRDRGWYVFHDVPAEAAKQKFNIDHVAVGPGGVWAIETKTRSKGNARPGRKDNEVTFNGSVLAWPWGEDSYGPEQAKNNAEWLKDWLNKRTGLNIDVRAALALPGWCVVGQCSRLAARRAARMVGNGPSEGTERADCRSNRPHCP